MGEGGTCSAIPISDIPACCTQGFMDSEAMVTQADLREKYQSVEDYEDDFL